MLTRMALVPVTVRRTDYITDIMAFECDCAVPDAPLGSRVPVYADRSTGLVHFEPGLDRVEIGELAWQVECSTSSG
jgi:hypothetical protein